MIVMKFGGSSLESANAIERVASIVKSHLARRPVVVVSAMGKTTDGLVAGADHAARGNSYLAWRQLGELRDFHIRETQRLLRGQAPTFIEQSIAPKFRELHVLLNRLADGDSQLTPELKDEMLSYGERLSSEIVAGAFQRLRIKSTHLDARRFIMTDNQFTHAAPLYWETYAKLRRALPYLSEGTVAVMGGFIGATEDGVTTTLGRGGSDLTGSIVGAGICADEIQIWTDVDGMLTCDPRVLDGGHRLRAISYREAEDMARLGAKVLHPATVAPAVRQRIPITIRNTRRPEIEGTQIVAKSNGSNGTVKSIACRTGRAVVHLDVRHVGGLPTITEGLGNLFTRHSIAVELVQARPTGVSFAIENSPLLSDLMRKVDQSVQLRVEEETAVIGLIGDGVGSAPAVMSRALSALKGIHVRMHAQGSALSTVCFAVPETELRESVESLHREFFSAPDPELFAAAREVVELAADPARERHTFALGSGARSAPAH
jgi:aspartate kinase